MNEDNKSVNENNFSYLLTFLIHNKNTLNVF
jgi:hypothetical protein